MTATQPTAPNYQIQVATVTKKSGGDGHIQVIIRPEPKLNDVSDIAITSPANGQSLVYSSNVWINGNAAYSNTAGTVTTAAQPNITSVGTLTGLSVSGTSTLGNIVGTEASFSGNAVVNGNLFVNGNLTYLNVETVAVEDPIIQLQTGANGTAPSSNSGKDIGSALNYYDTTAKQAFVGWKNSTNKIVLATNVSIAGEVVTVNNYGNTVLGGLEATTISATGNANVGNIGATNGVFTNVSGNGSALTAITGANVTGTVANATFATSAGSATTAGTVTTAAQPNITSVGTLTGLTVNGLANLGSNSNVKIGGGTTGYVLSTDGTGNLSWIVPSSGATGPTGATGP
jgi:hypothetical protein